MNHFLKIFSLSAFMLFVINGVLMKSVAEPAKPILFSDQEQALHLDKMKKMTPAQRQKYRNEQYRILRNKAAAIGYKMPAIPPWVSEPPAKQPQPLDTDISARHQSQLAKYRKDAEDKRKAIHKRLENQRATIKKRIEKLVEHQGIKPSETGSIAAPVFPGNFQPPTPPVPPIGPATMAPQAPPPSLGPYYPRFYQVPPSPPWGYGPR